MGPLQYFYNMYIQHQFGVGFIITEVCMMIGLVVVLMQTPKKYRDYLIFLADVAGCWLVELIIASLVFWISGYTNAFAQIISIPITIALYAIFRCKFKPDVRVVYSLYYYSILLFSLTVSAYAGESLRNATGSSFPLTEILQPTILLIVALFLKVINIDKYPQIPIPCTIFLVSIPVIYVIVNRVTNTNKTSGDFSYIQLLYETGIVLIEFFSLALYSIITRMNEKNVYLTASDERYRRDKWVMQTSKSQIEQLRKLRHDMKNQYSYMMVLIEEKKYDELAEYCKQYSGELYDSVSFSMCGNSTVDYILNFESRKAEEKGVKISSKIVVPPVMPVDDTDLCSLLSNIIDNAVENSKQGDEVTLSMEMNGQYYLIQITNPTEKTHVSEKGETTKSDKVNHGYGRKIVDALVKKYNGWMTSKIENGKYIVAIMILGRTDEAVQETPSK